MKKRRLWGTDTQLSGFDTIEICKPVIFDGNGFKRPLIYEGWLYDYPEFNREVGVFGYDVGIIGFGKYCTDFNLGRYIEVKEGSCLFVLGGNVVNSLNYLGIKYDKSAVVKECHVGMFEIHMGDFKYFRKIYENIASSFKSYLVAEFEDNSIDENLKKERFSHILPVFTKIYKGEDRVILVLMHALKYEPETYNRSLLLYSQCLKITSEDLDKLVNENLSRFILLE